MPGPVFAPGEHVTLRSVEREDLSFVHEQKNDPCVWRSLGWPKPENESQLETFFEETISGDESTNLSITVDEQPVGMVSFHSVTEEDRRAELGYWVGPPYQGNGYATAAVELLVDHGFREMGLHRVEAGVFERNDASQAVLEKLGFTHERTEREAQFVDGQYRDVEWFGLLREEWTEMQSASG